MHQPDGFPPRAHDNFGRSDLGSASRPPFRPRPAPADAAEPPPPLDPALWQRVLANVRLNHPTLNRTWFGELAPRRLTNGVILVHCRSLAQLNFLQGAGQGAFTQAAQTATNRLVTVSFHCENLPSGGVFGDGERPMPLSPDHAFDHFVQGPSNRLAHSAALAVADHPGSTYNPLFLHGDVGLGKTHLLQAIAMRVLDTRPDSRILYLSCEAFIREFFSGVEKGHMDGFRTRYRHADVLIVDDIQFLRGHEQIQEEFFHTFNTLWQGNKQIVLSADSPPSEIPALEARLVSRFNWGLVARIDPPGYETRVSILRKKANLRGLEIHDEVLFFIAARVESNTRELEGALTTVQASALAEGGQITLPLAKKALGAEPSPANGVKMDDITGVVVDFFGVRMPDMQGKKRNKSITWPRQVAMYLARHHTRYSLKEIGGFFGGRDHTTVMHGVGVVQKRMADDDETRRLVARLEAKLSR